jgi:hypothetical protein
LSLTQYTCNGSGSGGGFVPSQGIKLGFAASTTWTCPAGVTQIQVELWGGGGGAGGRGGFACTNTSCGSCVSGCCTPYGGNRGGHGGKGGYNKQIVNVIPGQVYTITVGLGGAAGATALGGGSLTYCLNNHPSCNGSSGSAGGNSSFNGLVIANGGQPGTGGITTYMSGSSVNVYQSCLGPPSQGIDGLNESVLNYNYPPQTSGTRTYLPTGYVVNYPGSQAPGGLSYSVTSSNTMPPSATSGENGFCIITY